MYTTINGWTKERMKQQIRAGNSGRKAVGDDGSCKYLTDTGNRCAVGCFIPDGHPGQGHAGLVDSLLSFHPDIGALMPLPLAGLQRMQDIHDYVADPQQPMTDALCDWIDANVTDSSQE